MTDCQRSMTPTSNIPRIEDTDEAWDTGLLGRDERYVVAIHDPEFDARVDASLGIVRKR